MDFENSKKENTFKKSLLEKTEYDFINEGTGKLNTFTSKYTRLNLIASRNANKEALEDETSFTS